MKNIWIVAAVLTCGFGIATNAFGQETPVKTVALIAISVDSPQSAVVTVAASTLSVSGTASGGTGITRVTWQTSNGTTGTAQGTSTWDAKDIPVTEGNTTIVLRAYDSKGSSAWVALVTVRQPVSVISSAAKLQQQPAL